MKDIIEDIKITFNKLKNPKNTKIFLCIMIVIAFRMGWVIGSNGYDILLNELNKLQSENKQLQDKVNQAKPYFEEQEKKKNEEQARLEAEKNAKEAKEKAEREKIQAENVKREQEQKAKEEAERAKQIQESTIAKESAGVNTDELKSSIKYMIEDDLRQNIEKSEIEELKVTEHLGTDSNKDSIVIARFDWNQFYDESAAKDLLPIFSNRIAAKIGEKLGDGSEIFLFWKANYAKLTSKHTYKVKDGKVYIGDVNYGYMR